MRRLGQRRHRNPDAADRVLSRLGVRPRYHRAGKVLGALLVFGVAAYFSPDVYDRLTHGARLPGPAGAQAPDGGLLYEDPITLASSAGYPVEQYSLARAIASEGGGKYANAAERQAIGSAIMNYARAKYGADGAPITRAVTEGAGTGYYGAQNAGKGRYVSTRFAPRARDLDLADDLLTGRLGDNTGGATHFFNPGLFAVLIKKSTKNYTKTWQDVHDAWLRDGYEFRAIDGVDPDHFVVAFKASGLAGLGLVA
jgi:hypothetical protein